jgi:pterin-4a-carbinolamine dehydratase
MSRDLSTLMREFLEPAVEAQPEISIFGSAIALVPIQAQQDTWEVVDSPKRLIKDFEFSEFTRMVDFLSELLEYQEEVNHHAKIITDYRTVRIESYTHDVDDVTELDKELANTADMIYRDVKDYGCRK